MEAIRDGNDPQWHVIVCEVNYENTNLACDHSGKMIESAYRNDAQNLDGMDIDELREFANDKTNNVILRRYAKMKAKAMECRLGGDIPAALQLEGMADDVYQKLPDELKW